MYCSATTRNRMKGGNRLQIGLIDVDAYGKKPKFPNLALMRISAWHKSQGDDVEWYRGPLEVPMYDIVYMSKVFSDSYTPDIPEPTNAAKVIKGGTGYCISLVNGREVFDESKNVSLPPEMEHMFPDYSIYPMFDFAISMTSRGCPRGCSFCIVAKKEGKGSRKVADVRDFWCGQKHIEVMDANLTACCEKRDLFRQYLDTGATITFNQGLDIRLLDDDDIADLNIMRLEKLHFAWDNPKEDLRDRFAYYAKYGKHTRHGHLATVYVLTNYNSTIEEDLYRIYTLREMGYYPFVAVYNRNGADAIYSQLQQWNNSYLHARTVERFEDFSTKTRNEIRKAKTRAKQQTLF